MIVWGVLTNSWEMKRSERQRRKGKTYPFKCRVPKNSKENRRTIQNRYSWPRQQWWCDHSPRVRHPGMRSQVGLRKQHYKASGGWNSSWAISNPKRWCCKSAALNMPASLKNSAVATTGKVQFSFQSQRKTMLKNVQTTAQLYSPHTLVK